MTFDPISEQRLSTVNPELMRRATNLEQALDAEGIKIRVTQAIRTYPEQDALYAKGRTVPSDIPCSHAGVSRPVGTCSFHPLGATVTNAKAGESHHNFGTAIDVAIMDAAGNPDWNESHPAWKRIVSLAPTYGLRDGVSWHDMPHLQLQELPETPVDAMRDAYANGGFDAVWASLKIDSFGPEAHDA